MKCSSRAQLTVVTLRRWPYCPTKKVFSARLNCPYVQVAANQVADCSTQLSVRERGDHALTVVGKL